VTPQSSVMYAAPLRSGAAPTVHALLESMNKQPGIYDPANDLIPLHNLGQVHFARVLVVRDLAAEDRAVYGLPISGLPEYLVFLAEIDGEEAEFREEFARVAESGLRTLLVHCEDFTHDEPLTDWLKRTYVPATASYVNWLGRTVVQVREEEVLRRTLRDYFCAHAMELQGLSAEGTRMLLCEEVRKLQKQGQLTLTAEKPTPLAWHLRNGLNLLFVPLVLLLLSPLLLLSLPFLLYQIRRWERNDPAVAPPVDPAHGEELLQMENYDVTNQFNVFGSLKPGRLRLWIVRFLLWITDYAARHLYHRGNLARVSTIHFARWVSMDGGQRMLFSSIYDGSLESYMDDFINKVGFGLNLTFSNGIGYPRTRWLLLDGCQDEQTFKRVLRRHQLPTEVWYTAHPGLTAANKHRNLLIRSGLQAKDMSEEQAAAWLALI
jgi:hypothetical protein